MYPNLTATVTGSSMSAALGCHGGKFGRADLSSSVETTGKRLCTSLSTSSCSLSTSFDPSTPTSSTAPSPPLHDGPAFRTRSKTTVNFDTSLHGILRSRSEEMIKYDNHAEHSSGQRQELESLMKDLSVDASPAPTSVALSPRSPFPLLSSMDEYRTYNRYTITQTSPSVFPRLIDLNLVKPPISHEDRKVINGAHGRDKRKFKRAVKNSRLHLSKRTQVDVGLSGNSIKPSKPGWSGSDKLVEPNLSKDELESKGIRFIKHTDENLQGLSSEGLQLFLRTDKPRLWVTEALEGVVELMNQPKYLKAFRESPNRRGKHHLALLGVTRTYSKGLHFTKTSQPSTLDMENLLEEFYKNEHVQKLSEHVSSIVRNWYPGIHARYARANDNISRRDARFRARFGLFPLFCFNYATEHDAVHCCAHTDWKNPAGGVCVVMAYGDYDSTKKHYLLFHDLGVALEVPPGVAVVYPSSLLRHENTDRVEMVEADTEETAWAGRGKKRGSLVWFAQANWIITGELGKSLGEFEKSPVFGNVDHLFRPPLFD